MPKEDKELKNSTKRGHIGGARLDEHILRLSLSQWPCFQRHVMFLDRSNTGIVDSNPARGMDVCPRFPVLEACNGLMLIQEVLVPEVNCDSKHSCNIQGSNSERSDSAYSKQLLISSY
jgi:hypothetical protein